jgi:hypothetical protein
MLCSDVVQAQSPVMLPVPPGARVRVTAPSLVGPLIANYLEMRGDTVVLVEDRAGQGLWSIPYSELRSLHLSTGQKRNNARYIVRGAGVGAAGGFVLGLAFAATVQPSDTGRKYKRITTGGFVAGAGALIGAVVGSRFHAEAWSPINLPRRLSLIPARHGLRIELTF